MLAERLPTIMSVLEWPAALEVSSVHSVAGALPPGRPLVVTPPFCAPHHTATKAAIVGGGSGVIRPGAASLADHGCLFLDEAPEFDRDVLDALRQPLESGQVVIAGSLLALTTTPHRAGTTDSALHREMTASAAWPTQNRMFVGPAVYRFGKEMSGLCSDSVEGGPMRFVSGFPMTASFLPS